jgi:hypothetical protein
MGVQSTSVSDFAAILESDGSFKAISFLILWNDYGHRKGGRVSNGAETNYWERVVHR